jgi:hypothetical protein
LIAAGPVKEDEQRRIRTRRRGTINSDGARHPADGQGRVRGALGIAR